MTSAVLPQPLTVRMFLAGDPPGPDVTESIAKALREQGIGKSALEGVRYLSDSASQAVHDEIAEVAGGFLDIELGDILVAGWRKYTELVGAAKRSLAVPGSKEMAVLAVHRVTWTHQPSVELLIDERRVYTFVFELTVEFILTGVVAVVRDGALTALRGGQCEVTVALTLEGTPLQPPRTANVDLALLVTLKPPIPLLRGGQERP